MVLVKRAQPNKKSAFAWTAYCKSLSEAHANAYGRTDNASASHRFSRCSSTRNYLSSLDRHVRLAIQLLLLRLQGSIIAHHGRFCELGASNGGILLQRSLNNAICRRLVEESDRISWAEVVSFWISGCPDAMEGGLEAVVGPGRDVSLRCVRNRVEIGFLTTTSRDLQYCTRYHQGRNRLSSTGLPSQTPSPPLSLGRSPTRSVPAAGTAV